MSNALVRHAALQASATSKRGILERVFARMFEGLVYAQIWEDPEVDLAATTGSSRREGATERARQHGGFRLDESCSGPHDHRHHRKTPL